MNQCRIDTCTDSPAIARLECKIRLAARIFDQVLCELIDLVGGPTRFDFRTEEVEDVAEFVPGHNPLLPFRFVFDGNPAHLTRAFKALTTSE